MLNCYAMVNLCSEWWTQECKYCVCTYSSCSNRHIANNYPIWARYFLSKLSDQSLARPFASDVMLGPLVTSQWRVFFHLQIVLLYHPNSVMAFPLCLCSYKFLQFLRLVREKTSGLEVVQKLQKVQNLLIVFLVSVGVISFIHFPLGQWREARSCYCC